MNIGIIGLGRVYIHYKKNFISYLVNEGHIIYLFDTNTNKLNDLIAPKGCIKVSSYEELISRKIDFAIVSTISGTHYQVTKLLLSNGINVLTEKPPTMSEAQLVELIDLANQSSLKYGVIFQNRLNPAIKIIKELIDKKTLGDIKLCSIRLHWCRQQNYYEDEEPT